MTAFVSDNDGATWKGGLLLDERESSYPDGIQAEDGTLFIICDHQRYTLNRAGKRGVGSVQLAVFSEEDARAGKPVTDELRLHQGVTQLQDTDDTSGAPGK
ncbi:MAG: exo-alpha-sialidase [Rhodopirellula sp.]|nr:exo-alpha-sialidase [Rhodopirellula sp.]